MPDTDAIRKETEPLGTRLLADGTPFYTDGMTPFDMRFHRTLIDIPVRMLHVKNSEGEDEYSKGQHILIGALRNRSCSESHHTLEHDFPGGHKLLKETSDDFREIANVA
jgi:hypothetical protein